MKNTSEFKSFKYRLYPNKQQSELIDLSLNANRDLYNYLLSYFLKFYEDNNRTPDYSNCLEIKNTLITEHPDYINVDKSSFVYTIKEVEKNFKQFKNNISNKPHIKDNSSYYACKFSNSSGCITVNSKIDISNIKGIKYKSKLKISGIICNATISKTSTRKYFASILCRNPDFKKIEKTGKSVGVDVGYMNLATLSDATIYKNNREHLRLIERISVEKKKLNRLTIGSNRYNKQRVKLAKLYEKEKNRRNDTLHKITTEIVKEYDNIYVETLNINYMIGKSKSPEKIYDAAWKEMQRMLEYKSRWYEKNYLKCDDTFKSSQTCSKCGYVYEKAKDFTLKRWICPKCNSIHDRDINAAINLLQQGNKKIK